MTFDKLPFNWFDILILILLAVGIRRGRKHGMSEELFGTLMWLAIAVVSSMAYGPIGTALAEKSVFSLLASYLMSYIGIALIVVAIFAMLKKSLGGKLIGSDAFGGSEFYLGMVAGVVRFMCILVAGLAILNARDYTSAEIKADQNYQNDVYGSNFFPSLYEIQAQVFNRSIAGPWIKNQLGFLLIKPTLPEHKEIKRREFASP